MLRLSGEIATVSTIRKTIAASRRNRDGVANLLPAQCRMARAALQLGVRELADSAMVSTNTITRFERGEDLKERTVAAIRAALEAAGVQFLADGDTATGPGVALKS